MNFRCRVEVLRFIRGLGDSLGFTGWGSEIIRDIVVCFVQDLHDLGNRCEMMTWRTGFGMRPRR